jgi:hypothetical protein
MSLDGADLGSLTTVQGQLERRQRETSHCASNAIIITPRRHGFVDVYFAHSSKELVGQLYKSAALLASPVPVVDVAE